MNTDKDKEKDTSANSLKREIDMEEIEVKESSFENLELNNNNQSFFLEDEELSKLINNFYDKSEEIDQALFICFLKSNAEVTSFEENFIFLADEGSIEEEMETTLEKLTVLINSRLEQNRKQTTIKIESINTIEEVDIEGEVTQLAETLSCGVHQIIEEIYNSVETILVGTHLLVASEVYPILDDFMIRLSKKIEALMDVESSKISEKIEEEQNRLLDIYLGISEIKFEAELFNQ
ncbi:hypothetical protein [Alkaliphilus transvaalensis]|uniref:hypothetical protein n=1 Tax=Alkaliphilus transvaalensis TaxID=114628 RepID=UPI000478E942|nr:hypothetical protein [Alkaliphilus transvaalensis]